MAAAGESLPDELAPPRCRPLSTLAELDAWKPDDPWNVCRVPLQPRPPAQAPAAPQLPAGGAPLRGASPPRPPRVQRVLHCHDMMGGYVQDADAQTRWGQADAYAFRSWSLIDQFCYFSHHRVTIPPRGWMEAAHRHGVSVLGTFITEWKEGEADNLRLLEGPPGGPPPPAGDPSYYYAERLVDVAAYYGFEGYLLNFESPVPSPMHAALLVKWVARLTQLMHERVPNSTVLWYDALDFSGRVRWQNQVNHNNIEFMRACDGIFTNYTWKEGYPALSAQVVPAPRRPDVYFGIDCFGRNTFGGGGFDSWKALEVIARAGLSAAIFAPGWTFENRPEGERTRACFDSREERFWMGVGGADPAEGVAGYVEARAHPSALPFATSFCRGTGDNFFVRGAVARAGPWLDLSCQSPQPSFPLGAPAACPPGADLSLSFDYGAAYDGGGSLLVSGRIERPGAHAVFRLLRTALEVPPSGARVTLAYLPAPKAEASAFALALALDDGTVLRMPCYGSPPEAVATSSSSSSSTRTVSSSSTVVVSSSSSAGSERSSSSSSSSSSSASASAASITLPPAAALGSACEGGWALRAFDVPPAHAGRTVREVLLIAGGAGVTDAPASYGVHLGLVAVTEAGEAQPTGAGARAAPASVRAADVSRASDAAAATLEWDAPPGAWHYDVYRREAPAGEWAFEGRARGPAPRYRVLARGGGGVEYAVQAVAHGGGRAPLARCATVRVA